MCQGLCLLVARELSFLLSILRELPEEDDDCDSEGKMTKILMVMTAHQSGANMTLQVDCPWFELNPAIC